MSSEEPQEFFYSLRVDDSDPEALICVESDARGFNGGRVYEDRPIEDWPEGVTFFVTGEHAEDYLVGGLHWIVLSERVRQVFVRHKVAGTEFLPVKVVHKETGRDVGPYWVLHVFRAVDALDWDRTHWMYPEKRDTDELPGLNILWPALRANALKGVDVFRLTIKGRAGVVVFLSGRLKGWLEEANATSGIRFAPTPTY